MPTSSSAQSRLPARPAAVVYAPSFFRTEEALLVALREGHRGARAVFFERHAEQVQEVLLRIFGADRAEDDTRARLLQRVMLTALSELPRFKGKAGALRPWLMRLAVREAARALERRRFRGLTVWFLNITQRVVNRKRRDASSVALAASSVSGAVADAPGAAAAHVRRIVPQAAIYSVLEQVPVPQRIAFCLHFIAQLDLGEVAELCDLSLSRARRAVLQGKDRFLALAASNAELLRWVA